MDKDALFQLAIDALAAQEEYEYLRSRNYQVSDLGMPRKPGEERLTQRMFGMRDHAKTLRQRALRAAGRPIPILPPPVVPKRPA